MYRRRVARDPLPDEESVRDYNNLGISEDFVGRDLPGVFLVPWEKNTQGATPLLLGQHDGQEGRAKAQHRPHGMDPLLIFSTMKWF